MLPPPPWAGGASCVRAPFWLAGTAAALPGGPRGRAVRRGGSGLRSRGGVLKPSELRLLARVQADLARLARYDDESVAGEAWVRQRYDSGAFPGLAAARAAAVRTAWHEAGHTVAALAVGARFSSASIHLSSARSGSGSAGRVHAVTGAGAESFVVDAAGQIAERLMDWSMLDTDAALRQWLPGWRRDGGDARRFRQAVAARPGGDEVAAWRHSEGVLTPRRLQVRQVARALLVAPRHLPYEVVAALAGPDQVPPRQG
jgi:hypothetical protein